MKYSAVMHGTGEVIATHDDEATCGRLAAKAKNWPATSLACPYYLTETRNIERGRSDIYVCIRRAGFDFPPDRLAGFIDPVKKGDEYYDIGSVSEISAGHAMDRMRLCDDLVSGPNWNPGEVHPFVRVAHVRLIEIPEKE